MKFYGRKKNCLRPEIISPIQARLEKFYNSTSNTHFKITAVHLMANESNSSVCVLNTSPSPTVDGTTSFTGTEQASANTMGHHRRRTSIEIACKTIGELLPNRLTPVRASVESGVVNSSRMGSMPSSDFHARNGVLGIHQELRKHPRATRRHSEEEGNCDFPIKLKITQQVHPELSSTSENQARSNQGTHEFVDEPFQVSNHSTDNMSLQVWNPPIDHESFQMPNLSIDHESFKTPQNFKRASELPWKPGNSLEKEIRIQLAIKNANSALRRHFPLIHSGSKGIMNSSRDLRSNRVSRGHSRIESMTDQRHLTGCHKSSLKNTMLRRNSNFLGYVPYGFAPERCHPTFAQHSSGCQIPSSHIGSYAPAHITTTRGMAATATRGTSQNEGRSKLTSPFIRSTHREGQRDPSRSETSKLCNNRGLAPTCCREPAAAKTVQVGGSKGDPTHGTSAGKTPSSIPEENPRRDSEALNSRGRPNSKGEDTGSILDNISGLLNDILGELSGDFECRGLELSLPIWKKELELCILSVEKVKSIFLYHQEQK